MTFSLINVYQQSDGKVSGSWIQDHIGTILSARQAAQDTKKVNGGKINIAIVREVAGKMGCYHHGLNPIGEVI
jgi:hypothetical protein